MKKILFLGALLIIGASSFGKTEILQPTETGGNTYNGETKLQLIADGNALDPTSGAWLEIGPIMSKGSNGSSLEFRFGELMKGDTATTEGSFYAEVKEYDDRKTATKLKFTGVADDSSSMEDGEIYVALRKSGSGSDKEGATVTSNVSVAASNKKDATITYNLTETKGGLVGSKDRYEGYVQSTIAVEKGATAGDFYDNSVVLVVKVNNITGNRKAPTGP